MDIQCDTSLPADCDNPLAAVKLPSALKTDLSPVKLPSALETLHLTPDLSPVKPPSPLKTLPYLSPIQMIICRPASVDAAVAQHKPSGTLSD